MLHEFDCCCREISEFKVGGCKIAKLFAKHFKVSEYFMYLVERCNCIASSAIGIRCCLSVVICLSSVTRVYCDKAAEARIM